MSTGNRQAPKDQEFSKLSFDLCANGKSESICNGHATNSNGILPNAVISEPSESSISDNTSNDDETVDRILQRADIIIGADGAFSKVRYELPTSKLSNANFSLILNLVLPYANTISLSVY